MNQYLILKMKNNILKVICYKIKEQKIKNKENERAKRKAYFIVQ